MKKLETLKNFAKESLETREGQLVTGGAIMMGFGIYNMYATGLPDQAAAVIGSLGPTFLKEPLEKFTMVLTYEFGIASGFLSGAALTRRWIIWEDGSKAKS